MTTVNVLDCPMGAGKTSAMINYINESPPNKKFIFVTPYLTEVKRIKDSCRSKDFKEPKSYGSKYIHLKSLLERGLNVVTTHALFDSFDMDIVALLEGKNYTLIIDEAFSPTDVIDISMDDTNCILNTYASVNKDNMLEWSVEYDGRFQDIYNLSVKHRVYMLSDKVLVDMFPVEVFKSFEEIYLMTYLFDDQPIRCYFDYHNLEYKKLYVKNFNGYYKIVNFNVTYVTQNYKKLIHIYESPKSRSTSQVDLNAIGNKRSALSKTWYKRNRNSKEMLQLKRNLRNYLAKIHADKSSKDKMWTTFSDFKDYVGFDGVLKGFLSCNIKASNEYKNRTVCAYLINRYMNPSVAAFYRNGGVDIDQDQFALSDLLQWLFRSAIRDGKEIWVYIPSSRMRNLLKQWIEENSKE